MHKPIPIDAQAVKVAWKPLETYSIEIYSNLNIFIKMDLKLSAAKC